MKGRARTVAVLGAGYVLGRRRKLRTVALVAAATAAGGTPVGGVVLRRGVKLAAGPLGKALGAMPSEVSDLVDTVRGDLVPAGRAAVGAAASSRVNALTDAIHERAELVRDPEAAAAKKSHEAADEADRADEAEDAAEEPEEEPEEEPDEADEEPDEADEKPPPRARRSTSTRRRAPVTRTRR